MAAMVHTGVHDGSLFKQGELALQMAIFAVASFKDLDELLLFNALALRSGQILRVLQQDTAQQARQVNHQSALDDLEPTADMRSGLANKWM